jgi:predicted nucleic acid-binding protein
LCAIAKCIAEGGGASKCTSIIVACELRFGIEESGSLRLRQQLDKILKSLDSTEGKQIKVNYLQLFTGF